MKGLDPRVQLAWLAALVIVALVGGLPGVGLAAAGGIFLFASVGRVGAIGAAALKVLPLAVVLAGLDALAGEPVRGLETGARIVALVLVAGGFASVADGDDLVIALRWLRVPFDVTFALVTGARLVPLAAADLGDLADAARLRGIDIDGSPPARVRSWARLLAPLLVVTIRRGLRLGEAMEVRGFAAGRPRTARAPLQWGLGDTAAVAAAALVVGAIALAGR